MGYKDTEVYDVLLLTSGALSSILPLQMLWSLVSARHTSLSTEPEERVLPMENGSLPLGRFTVLDLTRVRSGPTVEVQGLRARNVI